MSDQATRPGTLFVVDDEPNIRRVLSTLFTREGWRVHAFENGEAALNALADSDVDVIVTDLSMPTISGTDLLRRLRERGVTAPVLVMTAFGTIASAVEAMKLGAFDYLCKPFDVEQVKLTVQRALAQYRLQEENAYLRQELQTVYRFGNIIGASRRMQEVYAQIEKAARSRANVLVLGESGTGKELVARALHYGSPRANKRFVAVSCAALPNDLLESELFGHEKGAFTGANWQRAGRFELADGGTLFLDEIGDISLNVQTKLLRVIQEQEFERVGGTRPVKVDVRVIAATHRDLPTRIAQGEFREDLYYRLRVIEIRLPPLRERTEDIPLLAKHFLDRFAEREGRKIDRISPEAMAVLTRYPWPGNVRELENAIEAALVMADDSDHVLTPRMLPEHVRRGCRAPSPAATANANGGRRHLPEVVAEVERTMLLDALEETEWNLASAAEVLGITSRSIRDKVRRYGLTRENGHTRHAG